MPEPTRRDWIERNGRLFRPDPYEWAKYHGIQSFFLQFTGDDITENLSLREKLKNDYGVILPELNEDQTDVERYFAEIGSIIKTIPGFVLKKRVTLLGVFQRGH